MKFELNKSIEILERTPKVLKTLLENISEEWTNNNEGEGTWSPYEVVGHLIHGEKTDWISRTKIILSSSTDKTFKPFDRFAQQNESQNKSLHDLLEEFEILRNNNLITLKSFNIDAFKLEQKGVHSELGIVKLKELLACWVAHDLGHIAQITRVMAKQYKQEVGPWIKYLEILK